MLLQIKSHVNLIRVRILSILTRVLLTKDPDNKEISEDEKKEKGTDNPKKKAWWQGKKD